MTTVWKKNKLRLEGLENKDAEKPSVSNLDVTKSLSGTKMTFQNALVAIRGPILNSSDPNELPDGVGHESKLYTSIRENMATPIVKSFMPVNANKPVNDDGDIVVKPKKEGFSTQETVTKTINDLSLNDVVINPITTVANVKVNKDENLGDYIRKDNIDIGQIGDNDLKMEKDSKTINEILNDDKALLADSKNLANMIYFFLLLPVIYIAWFNWTGALIQSDESDIITYLNDTIQVNVLDPEAVK